MENIKLYKKGIVYKLYGNDEGGNLLLYVGSTKNSLCNRKAVHKYHARIHKEGLFKSYCSSFLLFEKCQNIKIEALEILTDCSRLQLREVENKYIQELECVNEKNSHVSDELKIQRNRAGSKKYYYANHMVQKEIKRNYYTDNREAVLERYRQNYEKIKEYNKKYRQKPEVIQKMKEYREKNKEKHSAYMKARYERLKNNNIRVINEQ